MGARGRVGARWGALGRVGAHGGALGRVGARLGALGFMSICTIEQLENRISLTSEEKAWKEGPLSLPLLITDYYMNLIDESDVNDPLRRQVVPSSRENTLGLLEDPDPLSELANSKTGRLIHRYESRAAFLATDICAQYCRHCFRRRFTGNMQGPASRQEVLDAAGYLAENTKIKELLLTGGDPLTLSDQALDEMICLLRQARPDLIIRICTRMVAVQPSRITDSLMDVFKKHNSAPFYLMVQFNHPRELTKEAVEACAKFIDAGIPAMNQSVLLRGVNDNADVLEELCNALVFARIKPYYLFQGDLVSGTSSFRVPLEKGLEIERELRRRLSGLAMPVYAADLPQGGGKVPLCGSYIEGFENGIWTFRTLEGEKRSYPDPQ